MKNVRKTLNLIALTVFMGSNLLTPISYAVDDLENVGENLQLETDSESVGSTYDIVGGGESLTNLGDDDLSDGADDTGQKETSEIGESGDDSGESDTQGFTQETQENAEDAATENAKTDTDNTVLDDFSHFAEGADNSASSTFHGDGEDSLEQNGKTQKTADDTATEKAKTDTDDTVLDYFFQTGGDGGDTLTSPSSLQGNEDNLEQSLTGEVENLSGEALTGEVEELTGTDLELSMARETLNEEEIKDTKTYNKVTVSVEALTGTFPQGTELRIKPITIKKELNEIKEQIIDTQDNIVEESELVAFDISFIYTLSDGTEIELQPKNGEGVKVVFNYEDNKNLSKADKNDDQEVKVFHIEEIKDEEGNKIGEEKVNDVTNKKESAENGIAVADAESFSIYAVIRSNQPAEITITYNANGGTFNGGTTTKQITYTKDANNLYVASENVQAPNKSGRTCKNNTLYCMFDGWYTDTSYTTEWLGVAADTDTTTKTVYAKWIGFDDLDLDFGNTTYTIMDRNLGAEDVAEGLYKGDNNNNPEDLSKIGKYYQWGNNYGFRNGVNGDTLTNYDDSNVLVKNTTSNPWGPGNYYSSATFIKRSTSPYRWDDADNANLWGGSSLNVSDKQGPCPAGYHIPSNTEWQNIYDAFTTWKTTSEGISFCNNYNTVSRCFAAKLKLPFAGYRDASNSNVRNQGGYGHYWSSTRNDEFNAYNLRFNSSFVYPQYSYGYRAYGFSVRCLKDSPNPKTFTLSFDAETNGGTTTATSVTANQGTVISLSTSTYSASKDGYTFVGWNTDKNATSALSSITLNKNETVYAIFSKTLTADFVLKDSNAATLSSTTATCTYYNNDSACTLTAPTLTAKVGYTVDGWSTTNGSTTADATTFTNGSIYYSVTHNNTPVTVTFNVNGNGGSNSTASCYKYNGNSTCTVSCPDITPANGFERIGWGIATDSHTANACAVNGTSPAVSSNTTYWAQSSKAGYSVTLTYQKSTGVSSVSPTSQTCDVATVYNGATQLGCTKSALTITCSNGYSNGVFSPSTSTAVLANTTYTATCSDTTAPVCSISTQPTRTSMSLVNGYNQGTVTFTCTDGVGIATTKLSESNITYDNSVVTLSNFTTGGNATSKTFTFTYTAKAQGSTTFTLKAGAVSDAAGNSNAATSATNSVTVDTTAPTITITQENAGTWTKSKSVTASASDGTLTMKESTSSTCNSSVHDFVTYADKNYISESDNGKYICYKAVDSVGNEAYESSAKVEKIDRTAPVLSGKTTFLSTWYTTPQTSTFTYSDTGAGINEGYNTASCIISTEGIDSTCQVTPNICDKVGNCNTTTQTSNSIKLDKTAPVFTGKTQFSTDWYNTNQTSYFTYEDTVSGINGDSTTSCVINEEGTTATCTVENTNICNNAGLCNTTNQTSNSIKLDKTNPTCSITGNPTSPTNQNVELTLNYLVEANQISDGYSWDGENYSTTKKFTVTQNGTYTGYVKDAAGNIGSCNVTVSMIDKVAPTITINNPDITPAQSKTITATKDKGTLYMAQTDNDSDCKAGSSLEFVAYDEITFNSESDNGKYVCYKAVDEAGNEKYEISAPIAGIDITAPVIGFANDVKKGPSQSDLVEVNWGDATVKKWRYSDTSGCSNNETLYDKTDSDSMNQDTETNNGKYICLFAKDSAGNVSKLASAYPINIDITNPTCSISKNTNNQTNGNITLTVTMSDTNVDDNGYKWNTSDEYSSTATKQVTENGTYTAYVKDLAGNENSCSIEISNIDKIKPEASITTTSNLKSVSQTATLSCTDSEGIASYYRGIKSNPENSDYTAGTPTTKTVNDSGTYYLFCKDTAGNVSDSASKTYHTYTVYNMLNAVDKSEGTYNSTNYTQTGSTSTYLAPAGIELPFSNIYTIPNYSSLAEYVGYTIADSGNPSHDDSVYLNGNSVYYFWFNRVKHSLTLQIDTGIQNIYYKVNSGSEYSSVLSTTVVSMKEGSNAYAYAVASNGYELTDAFKDYNAENPKTWNTITTQQTFLPDASVITYSIDYELDGGELEAGKTNPEEYTVETPNFVLNNPIKDGYTFAGWTGTALSDATETVTVTRGSFGDREYTATYNINNYNYRVEYYYDGELSGAATENASATFQDVINSYTGKNIDGYKLDHEIGLPLTITSTVENNVIKVYYVKDNFDYSIEYYYDNVKDDAKTVTGKAEFASQITTYPDKLIAGYVLSGTVGLPLTITSNPVNNLIKVYYKKSSDLSYTIKYKDTENNTLSGDVVVPNQTFGDEIIVTPGAIEGYVTPSAENVTITADSSANVVTFIYNKRTDLTYTIKYQNSVGTSISGDVVVENQTFGAEVTVIPGAIEGYNAPASTGFIIGVTNPDVVFVYTERNDLSYKIRYVDTNNHELSGDVVVNGQIFGDNVVVNAPEIPGYNTPASTGFTIKVVNPDVLFIYTPKTNIEYTVTYKDKYGSGLLANKVVNTGVMDRDVTENAPSIDGYEVQTGSFTIRLKATNNHIDFVYNPKEYAIRFIDGSGVETTVVRSGEYVSTILNKNYPDWSKDGYTIHWDKAIPDTMPLNGIEITASWTPNTNTAYKIEHYKEKLDGTYEKDLTENKTGTTDTTATATPKTDYEGFTYSGDVEGTKISGNIEGSGGLVLKLFYTRNSYNVSYAFTGDIPSGQSIPGGDVYKYQETVPAAPAKSADGYDFVWSEPNSFSMPANDVVITGTWIAHTNTQYLVYHQKEKLDGTYETVSVITGHGATDTKVTPAVNTYSGFNSPEAQEITIGGDGNTVLTYQYSRKVVTLTLVNDNGTPNTIITGKYESNVQKPATNPSKTGYTFTTWSPSIPDSFPATSGTYTAQYTLDTYTIAYHMNGGTNHTDNPTSYTYLSGAITLKEPTREDYVFSGWEGTGIDGISKVVTIPAHSTGNRTYTAIWAEDKNHDGQDDATETKYTVTINYVYSRGGTATGSYTTGNQLSGFTYDVTSPSITNYHADKPKVSGTITGNVVETVTYTPNTDTNGNGIADELETKHKVTVNYVYSRGGTATGSVSGMYLSGIAFNFVSPTIPNYTANLGSVSGTGKETEQTFTVTYTPIHDENHDGYPDEEETKYTVTINYVYSRGGTATGSYTTGNQLSGFTYNVASPNIQYYHADKENVSGTVTGNVVETVTYTPNNDTNGNGIADEEEQHYILTIHYVNGKGGKVYDDYTGSYVSGASYNIVSTPKTYYTIQTGGEVISGVMGTGNIEKTVVYLANHDTNNNGIADEEEDVTPTPAPSGGSSSGGGGRRINPSDNDRQIHGSADNEQEIGDNSDKKDQNKGTDDKTDSNKENYTEELINAYSWAKTQGITTMPTIERAKLYDGITREQLAKMMVVYVSKVLGKQPIRTDIPKYRDVNEKNRGKEMTNYIHLAYQYQIMGIDYKGNPIRYFNPSGKVTRAEFATVLSRVLYGNKYNQGGKKYYEQHIQALNKAGILTNNNPDVIELRGWIMLMLHRSLKKLEEK